VLGLLGPNGAGKSSFMRMLATIAKPSTGTITWDGIDIAKSPDTLRAVLGYLIFKSGYFPKVLGVLFIAAGFGYLIDSFALLLSNSYTTTPGIIAMVISISEIAFPLWLLIKGVNWERYQEHVTSAN